MGNGGGGGLGAGAAAADAGVADCPPGAAAPCGGPVPARPRGAARGGASSPPPAPRAPRPITVRITNTPDRFAPSAENCEIRYNIADPDGQATAARVVIQDHTGTEVAVINGIPFSAGSHTQNWTGSINQGARSGGWVTPHDSSFTIEVQVNPGAAAVRSNTRSVAVEIHSLVVSHTPAVAATPLRIYKPTVAAVDVLKEVTATVRLRKTDGSPAATQVPIRVDWTFTPQANNCPKAKGGKDNTDRHFTAVAAFPMNGGGLTDANTTTNNVGETKVTFTASVIAGDRFTVQAKVLRNPASPAAGDFAHHDSPQFQVWKRLDYNGLYRMQTGPNAGVDVGALCVPARMQPAYTPAFTQYSQGAVTPIAYQQYLANLVAPTAAQLPANSAVRVTSDGADTRAVTIHGLVVAADGSTSNGSEALTLAGTTNVTGVTRFQRITRATTTADPARTITLKAVAGGVIGTVGPRHASANFNHLFDTNASVQTKAQSWADANWTQVETDMTTLRTTIAAAGYHLVGCAYLHPKHDGRPSGRTTFYAAYMGIQVRVANVPSHPDQEWAVIPGINQVRMSCIFLNAGTGAYANVVSRHEIGHASDHEPFSLATDPAPTAGATPDPAHCPDSSCLMYYAASGNRFCDTNPYHSRKRVMGWRR